MKKFFTVITLAVFFYGLLTPTNCINVDFNLQKGGKTVSSSAVYNLDKSTRLKGSATLGDGEITKDLTASGWGKNRISISSSANGKSTGSKIESSGEFHTAASSGASDSGAFISQDTDISGSSGGITYYADSPNSVTALSSEFDGEGDLSASVFSAADENTAISGNIDVLGIEMFNDESMQIIGSGDVAMSIEGLSNDGQGSFGLSALNARKDVAESEVNARLKSAATTAKGGNSRAYILTGIKWNTKDPQLKWVLKNDKYMTDEGLNADNVKSSIEAASNTWDDATNQNLFADGKMVTLDSKVATEKYNKINSINWKPFNKACVAYARTYYSLKKVDGYKSALDSDIVFNTGYGWCADNSNTGIDVQSVALHEIGHTIGLGDLYGKPQFKRDTDQAMHYYNGIQRTLGNGDASGVWRIYG